MTCQLELQKGGTQTVHAVEITYEDDPEKFSLKEWDEHGNPCSTLIQTPELHLQELAKQLTKVTDVLTQFIERINALSGLSQEESNQIQAIDQEVAMLKKINQDYLSTQSELLWKGPQAYKKLEQQMQSRLAHLTKNLSAIQNTLITILNNHIPK